MATWSALVAERRWLPNPLHRSARAGLLRRGPSIRTSASSSTTMAETLTTIAADPEHLGAEIGFFAVLHRWGQNLQFHPHLHCVVPGGGLSPDGQYRYREEKLNQCRRLLGRPPPEQCNVSATEKEYPTGTRTSLAVPCGSVRNAGQPHGVGRHPPQISRPRFGDHRLVMTDQRRSPTRGSMRWALPVLS